MRNVVGAVFTPALEHVGWGGDAHDALALSDDPVRQQVRLPGCRDGRVDQRRRNLTGVCRDDGEARGTETPGSWLKGVGADVHGDYAADPGFARGRANDQAAAEREPHQGDAG